MQGSARRLHFSSLSINLSTSVDTSAGAVNAFIAANSRRSRDTERAMVDTACTEALLTAATEAKRGGARYVVLQQAVESTSAAVSPTSDQNAATRPHSGGLCISKTSTIVSYRGVLSWLLTFLLVGCCYNSDYISDGPNVMKWRSGSGALGLALTDMEELKADGVIAKQVTNVYSFCAVVDFQDVYKMLRAHPLAERCFFEVITRGSGSKTHFDIEWDKEDADKKNCVMPLKADFLGDMCDSLTIFIKKHYGKDIDWPSVIVTDASIEKKHSFHVILPWIFFDLDERRIFCALLKSEAELAVIVDGIQRFKGCPDTAIYTTNRLFRMTECIKLKKDNPLRACCGCTRSKPGALNYTFRAPENDNQAGSLYFLDSLLTSNLETCTPLGAAIGVAAPVARNQRGGVFHRNVAADGPLIETPLLVAAVAALRGTSDLTSMPVRWDSETSLLLRPNGLRQCPMGVEHSSNGFHIKIINNEFCVVCTWSGGACGGVEQPIGELPISWSIPREIYRYQRPDGGAAVRPYKFNSLSAGVCCIVDCTDCGGGKTFQARLLIASEHTEGTARLAQAALFNQLPPAAGVRVLIILHRVNLCIEFHNVLAGLGFDLYTDPDVDVANSTRLIICIDSLHKNNNECYDLVIIDEVTEVVKQMCGLKCKAYGSGRWTTWSKIRIIMANASRSLLLSAQADTLVNEFLSECGVKAHWQQNGESPLSHLHYVIKHYNHTDMGYRELVDALEEDKKIVCPCAEQRDMRALFGHVQNLYPDKIFLAIDSTVTGQARVDALAAAKSTVFDCLFYTASLDCGFSIDIPGYHRAVVRFDCRSVGADVIMQMAQRVRSLNENIIVICCESGVKDWKRFPGYDSIRVSEIGEPLVQGRTLKAVNASLYDAAEPFYFWESNKKVNFKFTRSKPPPKRTLNDARNALMSAANLGEVFKSDPVGGDSGFCHLFDAAEVPLIKAAVANELNAYSGIVNLMVRVVAHDMNKRRDLLNDVIRIITLQGAAVTHEFMPFDGLPEESTAADVKKERERRLEVFSQEIINAEVLSMGELQRISACPSPTREEAASLERAYMAACFGEQVEVLINTSNHAAFTTRGNQTRFRELCFLNDLPGDPGSRLRDMRERDLAKTAQQFTEKGHHKYSELLALNELLSAYGFNEHEPLFGKSKSELTDGQMAALDPKLRDVVVRFNALSSGKTEGVKSPRHSASGILTQNLSISVKKVRDKNQFEVFRSGAAKHWPVPSYDHYIRQLQFFSDIHSAGGVAVVAPLVSPPSDPSASLLRQAQFAAQSLTAADEVLKKREQEVKDRSIVKSMRESYATANFFDLSESDDGVNVDGAGNHHFNGNMNRLPELGLPPFPGTPTTGDELTWSIPDGMSIDLHLVDYYPDHRIALNWELVKRWLEVIGVRVFLHNVDSCSQNQCQIGASCGVVAAKVLTLARLEPGTLTNFQFNRATSPDVLKEANTRLAALGKVPPAFAGQTYTQFLSESAVNELGRHFMGNSEVSITDPFRTWPFECCTIDQFLVQVAQRIINARDNTSQGQFYYCVNSEATGSSGYHWASCILKIHWTAGSVAASMIDDTDDDDDDDDDSNAVIIADVFGAAGPLPSLLPSSSPLPSSSRNLDVAYVKATILPATPEGESCTTQAGLPSSPFALLVASRRTSPCPRRRSSHRRRSLPFHERDASDGQFLPGRCIASRIDPFDDDSDAAVVAAVLGGAGPLPSPLSSSSPLPRSSGHSDDVHVQTPSGGRQLFTQDTILPATPRGESYMTQAGLPSSPFALLVATRETRISPRRRSSQAMPSPRRRSYQFHERDASEGLFLPDRCVASRRDPLFATDDPVNGFVQDRAGFVPGARPREADI